jgi:hypothetical protein
MKAKEWFVPLDPFCWQSNVSKIFVHSVNRKYSHVLGCKSWGIKDGN